MPILEGELDKSKETDKDVSIDIAASIQRYEAGTDAITEALRNDKGLVVAEVNKYLPDVLTTLGSFASLYPGAGPLIGAIVKLIPKQI